MPNEPRPPRKTNGKPDSSSSVDTSGLRRSTRGQPTPCPSPVSVRKSQRLEKTAPGTGTGMASPVRRSERGSGSKGGNLRVPEGSTKERTLKEIAEAVRENKGSSPDVGSSKRKNRLSAREFKAMFKAAKNVELEAASVEPDTKKRKVEQCEDNEDSGRGEALQENHHEDAVSSLGNSKGRVQDKCDDGTDRGAEEPDEGAEECADGEAMEEDCARNGDGGSEGSNSDAKNSPSSEKHGEREDGEGLEVSRSGNLPNPSSPSTSRIRAEENIDNTEDVEADDSVMEKLVNQEIHPTSDKLSDDDNGLGCIEKLTSGTSGVGREDTNTNAVPSVSLTCKVSILAEKCAICSKMLRLDCNSPKQALCCCLSNSTNGADAMSVSKDRGKCLNVTDEHGPKTKQSDPPVVTDRNSCVICKHAGKLLYCCGKGCQRSYHPSCLGTPEDNIHLFNWYCSECTKRKLAFGVHSVSEGIESVLDVKEVDLLNIEGAEKEKQYFVKYKGLAHIHNRWIPETQLLHEAPELLAKVNEQIEGRQWKSEWAVPQRLLLRRSLQIVDDQDASSGLHEWLVKWCGLDYDQATWELEDSACFKKPEGSQLFREYETRHNRARSTCTSRYNEVQERVKSGKLSVGGLPLPTADSCFMNSFSKLLEYHHKGHNAVLLDKQDRVMKMVYFVSSIMNYVHHPLLIIAPHASLSYWEAEFSRLAASINVVVYGGNTDARKIIRSLEFYEKGGQVMLQVLLSSVEAISEDFQELKGIVWEAVTVDDCQKSCVLAYYSCIKNLTTSWRLLLLNDQLKDTVAEYISILSLLEPGPNPYPGLMDASNEDINILKEKLSSYIVCARFQEYWVPVEISNIQLEQYCSLLLSNSTILRSCSKSDPVSSLKDILVSTRKCCDHPYTADPSLLKERESMYRDNPDVLLDSGVKASGKLQLLDKLLPEFRNQKAKVIILFQSFAGSRKESLGYVLEDLLLWRFGVDSYEHVACGGQPGKKQVALSNFNKATERCFLLLETRACASSIKLSSVDAVIILNSDWNPLNDLKALQKITIDSKLKEIKVFRLYCPCTVEEKVLILSKNDMLLDNNLQVINSSTKQMLLMWGSAYLFSRLDELHSDKGLDFRDNVALASSLLTDVCQEVVSLVQNNGMNSSKYVSVARQNGRCYLKNIPLFGEKLIHLDGELPPHTFWMKLLEGKQPQWKYLSESYERNRKRVHYSDELYVQNDEVTKKRKRMDSTIMDIPPQQVGPNSHEINDSEREHHGLEADNPSHDKDSGPTLSIVTNREQRAFGTKIVELDDRNKAHDQSGFFEMLKPTVSSLCEALLLKDEVKRLAVRFLEYVVNNHRVTREPETILQAFQISVCWTAAAMLKNEIDHKKSLAIAKEKMNFKCLEREADFLYSKMKLPMKIFLSRSEECKISNSSNPSLATNGITRGLKENCVELPLGSVESLMIGLEGSSVADFFDKQVLSLVKKNDKGKDCLGYIAMVKNKCEKQMERLKKKQNEEFEKFANTWEEKRVELETKYKVNSAAIRYALGKSASCIDRLKILDDDYAKNREDLENQISNHRKELEDRQQEERDNEQKKIARLMKLVQPVAQNELLESPDTENRDQLQTAKHIGSCNDSNRTVCVPEEVPEQQNSVREATEIPEISLSTKVSDYAKNLENTALCKMPFDLSDKQGAGCETDISTHSLENVLTSQGAATCSQAGEAPCSLLPEPQGGLGSSAGPVAKPSSDRYREEPALEQHFAPAAENGRFTNRVDVAVAEVLTAPTSNQVNGASTSLCCESTHLLQSPIHNSIEQRTAEGSTSQGLGHDSVRLVDGAEECAPHVSETHNTSPSSSSDRDNPMSSDLLRNEGTRILPATTYSLPELTTDPSEYNQSSVVSNDRLVDERNRAHTSVQDINTQMLTEHGTANASAEAASQGMLGLGVDCAAGANSVQGETHVSVATGAFRACVGQPNPISLATAVSRAIPSYYSDPLQNECDRLCKEIREITSSHEEKKLQLKTECDKEIEELVAQIRKKYDAKIEEAESLFSCKKIELEKNQNRVMMNRMLAEAFRSKCTDSKAGPGLQQGGMKNGISTSSGELLPQSRPMTRPSSAAGPFVVGPSAASPRSATPPVRAVYPSSAPSSTLTRSPHINASASTGGRQIIRHEMPVPVPQLQLRSTSSPMFAASKQCSSALAMQSPNSNPASSSSALVPPRPPQPPAFLSPYDRSLQAETSGRVPALNFSTSATELLMGIARQNEANLCRLPNLPLPDNVPNHESWDISQFGGALNVHRSPSSLSATNVVCLSDDDD